jgi:hypothetical protein
MKIYKQSWKETPVVLTTQIAGFNFRNNLISHQSNHKDIRAGNARLQPDCISHIQKTG